LAGFQVTLIGRFWVIPEGCTISVQNAAVWTLLCNHCATQTTTVQKTVSMLFVFRPLAQILN
jgi:hypothetical protein